jgi:hypothetical protein
MCYEVVEQMEDHLDIWCGAHLFEMENPRQVTLKLCYPS